MFLLSRELLCRKLKFKIISNCGKPGYNIFNLKIQFAKELASKTESALQGKNNIFFSAEKLSRQQTCSVFFPIVIKALSFILSLFKKSYVHRIYFARDPYSLTAKINSKVISSDLPSIQYYLMW